MQGIINLSCHISRFEIDNFKQMQLQYKKISSSTLHAYVCVCVCMCAAACLLGHTNYILVSRPGLLRKILEHRFFCLLFLFNHILDVEEGGGELCKKHPTF